MEKKTKIWHLYGPFNPTKEHWAILKAIGFSLEESPEDDDDNQIWVRKPFNFRPKKLIKALESSKKVLLTDSKLKEIYVIVPNGNNTYVISDHEEWTVVMVSTNDLVKYCQLYTGRGSALLLASFFRQIGLENRPEFITVGKNWSYDQASAEVGWDWIVEMTNEE